MDPLLTLRGAREHNLRQVDLQLPLGQWIAVVGPSGSGKTSLVFDSIVREGQRRLLGSLSARARHFYGKLGRAQLDSLSGLPAAIAVGQQTATHNPRSSVGTLTGLADLLRLLFARRALDPGGVALTRGHFSANHPDGACEACAGLGLEDRVTPERLVADPERSIRAGALAPTLKNGYTVYSQVTLEVMDRICRAHGFDVDTPWRELSTEQQAVVMHGSKALVVPFGKHPIESRMRWQGITARPREQGHYRGLIPVIEETLKRNRNPNVLRYVESVPCSACSGSRLARPGREAELGGRRLPELLSLPARCLGAALDELPSSAVLQSLRPSFDRRLERMLRLGLGHLSLDRPSPTLSGGEAQRLRLSAQLGAGLGRQLIAFDEPTLGLHPSEQDGLRAVLDELRELGNTLLVVEHDPDLVRHADHLVRLGPGAGSQGGRLLENRPLHPAPADADGPLGRAPPRRATPRTARGVLALRGATLHNLREADLEIGLGTFHVITGPSGAGKSSLLFGTLLPALQGAPGGPFRSLEGAPPSGVQALDARPLGRTPRSTPATWSGLFELVRKRFAALPAARERGLGPGAFSYNNKQGRCPDCQGLGFGRIGLHLLEDLELVCPSCGGGRYAPDVLDVRLHDRNVAQVLALSVDEAADFFADDPPLRAMLAAMADLGLGYLGLGQSSNSLSRGEGQRIKLATLLGRQSAEPSLVLLDEPDRGLHPDDVRLLLAAIDALVDAGHTVVAISHHRHLWAAADALTELREGRAQPMTSVDLAPLGPMRGTRMRATPADVIRLEGVTTHNLANLDVTIPHGRLTVIAGVSGSGKSSLAFDTLAAEAWRRFSESLPFQVRRFMRRMPAPRLKRASGLGPTLVLAPGQARAGARSTVATQSEIGPLLRLLWSRAGTHDGQACGLTAGHFSSEQALGACLACEGRGFIARCDAQRLVSHPERPLADGALAGTRPGRFFSEPDGQHMASLRAAVGPEADLDRPWSELPPEVRRVALEGAGERRFEVTWAYRRGRRTGEHHFEGPWLGLLALVEREALRRTASRRAAEWRAPLVDVPCETCRGSGLRHEVARVRVGGLTLPAALALPLCELLGALEEARQASPRAAPIEALLPELRERVDDLTALGLGHLCLDRRSRTLSDGELQRTRLASVLRAGLTGLTIVLDEPATGLHARDVERLTERLRGLVEAGNTLVVVSHRPELLRAAEHLIELGPGPGAKGGHVVAQGPPEVVLAGDGPTARALAATARGRAGLRRRMVRKATGAKVVKGAAEERGGPQEPTGRRRDDQPGLRIVGARAHNLQCIDVELPASGFVCVTGVSGSGKSSLVFDVLGASAQAGAPVECTALLTLPGGFAAIRNAREASSGQVLLTSMGLMTSMTALFHGDPSNPGLARATFSFLSPAGRCETCKGSGVQQVSMDFMADLSLPCPACDGRRYRDEPLAARWRGLDLVHFLDLPLDELLGLVPRGRLRDGLAALVDVGLGYLSLGRRSSSLSHGERQRVLLASGLSGREAPLLWLLDEPASGLHEADLLRLRDVFDRLVAHGDLIVAAEHRSSLIAAADLVLELGPGSGALGGRLVGRSMGRKVGAVG